MSKQILSPGKHLAAVNTTAYTNRILAAKIEGNMQPNIPIEKNIFYNYKYVSWNFNKNKSVKN